MGILSSNSEKSQLNKVLLLATHSHRKTTRYKNKWQVTDNKLVLQFLQHALKLCLTQNIFGGKMGGNALLIHNLFCFVFLFFVLSLFVYICMFFM